MCSCMMDLLTQFVGVCVSSFMSLLFFSAFSAQIFFRRISCAHEWLKAQCERYRLGSFSCSFVPTHITSTLSHFHSVSYLTFLLNQWTKEKENKIKDIITDQMNEFCKKQPQSCNINPNSTNNRYTYNNNNNKVILCKKTSTSLLFLSPYDYCFYYQYLFTIFYLFHHFQPNIFRLPHPILI